MNTSNNKPFFSVITITKNSFDYVNRNIDSVLAQKCRDFEHIFIDGKSVDGTVNLIKRYKKNNKNVRFFTQNPEGISVAMNKGIEKAKGNYIIHLHSDDWFFDKNVLSKVKKILMQDKKLDWIYGKILVREENKNILGEFPKFKIFQKKSKDKYSYSFLKYFNFIPHQAVFIKKDIFQKYGFFDESISSKMDYDLWFRIINKTCWKYFDQTISNYTIRADAESSGSKNLKKNLDNSYLVKKRYINSPHLFFSKIVDFLLIFFNKTIR